MTTDDLLPLLVAGPVVLAVTLAATGRWLPRPVVDALSLAGAASIAGLALLVAHRAQRGTVTAFLGGWMPHRGVTVGVALVADPLAAGLLALIALLGCSALWFSRHYFEEVEGLFHALVLMFVAGMAGFVLAGDVFTMFVFFELMSVAAFALTGYLIEEQSALHGALNFAVINSLGAYTTLLGIALLYARTGALNLAQMGEALTGRGHDGLLVGAFALVCTGWLVKAAVVPFQFWMADAHAVAPSPVCVLFSGVMVELGLYGVLRVHAVVFAGALGDLPVRHVLLVTGAAAAVVGSVMCVHEEHLKRMLAFSTVAHVGLIAAGLAALDTDAVGGVALYVVAHAGVKGALFLCAGVLRSRFDTISERDLHGRGRDERTIATVWLVAALGLAAVPPAGLWFGKDYFDEAAVRAGHAEVVVLGVLVSALTAGAALRAWARVFRGLGVPAPARDGSSQAAREAEPETSEQLPRTPLLMKLPPLALLLLGWGAGVLPSAREAALAAAHRLLDGTNYRGTVLHARVVPVPHVPVPPDITALGLSTGLAAGLLAVVVAGLSARGIQIPRLTEPFASLHSGRLGDDVAWWVLGVGLLGGLTTLAVA